MSDDNMSTEASKRGKKAVESKAPERLPLLESAEQIRRILKVFEGLASAVETMEKVGSVDQAMREREALILSHGRTLDSLKERIQSANADLAATQVACKKTVDEANQMAEAVVEKAQADARVKARSIIDGANEAAAKAEESAKAVSAQVQQRVEQANREVQSARELAAEYTRKAEAEQRKLETLRGQIEALKAKLG